MESRKHIPDNPVMSFAGSGKGKDFTSNIFTFVFGMPFKRSILFRSQKRFRM
jgi:hypothetical protein